MAKKNILEELRKFEETQEKRVERAGKSAEKKVENAEKNAEKRLEEKKAELMKERESLVKKAATKAKKDAVNIHAEFADKEKQLTKQVSKNKQNALDAVFEEVLKIK